MINSSASICLLPASVADAVAIAEIYNQGIRSRQATFEIKERSVDQILGWFLPDRVIVVARDIASAAVIGFAAVFEYRQRECYRGVGEFSIYVHESHRESGVGRQLMLGLLTAAQKQGFWKLLSRVFPENTACRRLLRRTRFREVGVYKKHAQLEGVWRDVVIVERILC